ncbi:MAG: hypothetical protein M9927_07555 [Anaerolineae bacterium]|nr:hypothetical protein [Anaerolineae bacterium]
MNSPAVLDVRDFGAAGDGKALDTAAIQACLDACSAQGGGTVCPLADDRSPANHDAST